MSTTSLFAIIHTVLKRDTFYTLTVLFSPFRRCDWLHGNTPWLDCPLFGKKYIKRDMEKIHLWSVPVLMLHNVKCSLLKRRSYEVLKRQHSNGLSADPGWMPVHSPLGPCRKHTTPAPSKLVLRTERSGRQTHWQNLPTEVIYIIRGL